MVNHSSLVWILETSLLIIGLDILIRYFYRLFSGPEPLSTFEKERAWHVTEEVNLVSMQVGFGFFK